MNILNKLEELGKNYKIFSSEKDFVDEIKFWVVDVVRGSFVEQNLSLVESFIDRYENSKNSNRDLTNSVREIVKEGYTLITK